MPKFKIHQYLALIFICLVFLLPVRKSNLTPSPVKYLEPELKVVAPVPVLKKIQTATISAESAVVVDLESGSILFQKNSQEKIPPASTTKMMTALIARELYDLGQTIEIKHQPSKLGNTVGFFQGENFLAEDLIKALLINSGNDAAEILAANHPGGTQAFIDEMNQKAQKIGMRKTIFTNPAGFDGENHYSTAFDLSLLARELMRDATLKQMVGTEFEIITDQINNKFYLYNTNLLLGLEPGVIGIKTGTTDLAGETLVTQINRQGHQLIIVVLGSQDRYADTRQLIEWVFSHYQWHQI